MTTSQTVTNNEIRRSFHDAAIALELVGVNPFRVNAHMRVARALKSLTREISAIVQDAHNTGENPVKSLTAIDGVGKGSATKIIEYIETGCIAEHASCMDEVPTGLFDILTIQGLGPKTVKLMWEELGITSLYTLKAQIDSPELLALPRMGSKSIQNIKDAIAFSDKHRSRIPIGLAYPLADTIVSQLRLVPGVHKTEIAGSVRRGCETVNNIDIIVAANNPASVCDAMIHTEGVVQVLETTERCASVRISTEGRVGVGIQVNMRIVPLSTWGSSLVRYTGSYDHLAKLENHVKTSDTDATALSDIVAKTEDDFFSQIGLPYIQPELREGADECDLTQTPTLIEQKDIVADLHTHTVASDGKMTIDELVAVAQSRGLHTLAITDHSVSSSVANGLSVDRLRRHIDQIHEANERSEGITVLAGSEVDILADGRLDYDDEILELLDVVVASPHIAFRQDKDIATKRMLKVATHPLVHIIGHPTGRKIGTRQGMDLDFDTIFAAAAEHHTALEINANWVRLDLNDRLVRLARTYDCVIAINTDAHYESNFESLPYGIMTARRAGLQPEHCMNTWAQHTLLEWLKR